MTNSGNNNKNSDKNGDNPRDQDPYDTKDFEQQREIKKFIENAIHQAVAEEASDEKKRLSDYGNLLAINSEWLDSFILIGYDMRGEEVVISNTRCAKDSNAVLSLLKKAFINLVVKREME